MKAGTFLVWVMPAVILAQNTGSIEGTVWMGEQEIPFPAPMWW